MNRILPIVAAMAATLVVPAAHSAIIVDDFSQPIPGQVIADNDGTADTLTTLNPSAVASSRDVTHELLTVAAFGSNGAGNLSSANTGGPPAFVPGRLNMSNGNDVDSVVTATWTLAALGPFVGNATFLIDVLSSDPGVTGAQNSIEAFFNGVSLGTLAVAGTPPPAAYAWTLDAAQTALLAGAGNTFRLVFNGAPAWDMSVDNLRVPEPGTLALLGLGLIGLGLGRRRKA